ncbi:XRE family transcriptional regulator [Pseudonocardia acaciae]|uniref:XRE family transcriptional regulator n=1 Tax=Pseudonocardia acaciae TaxID=551276 RepID=UPI000B0A72A2|nr:XRE family transcriptional regulator [Pseudonocardia acaciae]
MAEKASPRTRLEQLLAQRHMTVDDFRARFERLSGDSLSARQAYRWVAGSVKGLPYPRAQGTLERIFGEPAARLLGPPLGAGVLAASSRSAATHRGTNSDWQGQLVALSAERARDFLTSAEATNVGTETVDQLADDIRRLAVAYPRQPLASLLGEIVDTQSHAFGLLEGRQRPEQARELYLLAGVASGLMAKASHDLGAPHDAITQARAAYTCADNAGHDGLRAWARGLQSLISYWAGRLDDAVRYAEQGSEAADRAKGTASVWLAAGKARALAALGKVSEAGETIQRAQDAREQVRPDELDGFGGMCTFNLPRQYYYAADAMRWGGAAESERTERLATQAIEAYEAALEADRAFGDEAGARCALAVARIERGELDGAAEAMTDVLSLPTARRIHGVVTSVDYVRQVLARAGRKANVALELEAALLGFSSERLAVSR